MLLIEKYPPSYKVRISPMAQYAYINPAESLNYTSFLPLFTFNKYHIFILILTNEADLF